ncbi:MAG: branched-chain amino acid ABC transporter permease [Smithellaceae bacterium]|nr:branched-chain amino acid ABC transporter permease [Smithellaceae bacterium]
MPELLISGLVMGSIYALLALAINIIYSTTGIINFAHGELVMLGGMFGLVLVVNAGMPLAAGIVVAGGIIAVLAVLLYYSTIKPFGDNLGGSLGWLMATLGAGIIFRNVAMLIWGSHPRPFPPLGGTELINIFGVNILQHEIWVLVITFLIAIFFNVVLDKTILGSAIKATASNRNTTRLMGISAEKMVLACFGMSGAVAAVAGFLISPITFAGPEMTVSIGLKGFGAAIIGGLGSSRGAFVGGLILGILEALSMSVISPGYKDAIVFLVMILTITIKPEGIFNVAYEKKV